MKWYPDTCKCIFDFEGGMDTPYIVAKKCEVHINFLDKDLLNQVYVKENKKRQEILWKVIQPELQKLIPDLYKDKVDEVEKQKVTMESVEVLFDVDRKPLVKLTPALNLILTPTGKNQIKTALDTKIEAGIGVI